MTKCKYQRLNIWNSKIVVFIHREQMRRLAIKGQPITQWLAQINQEIFNIRIKEVMS
jgi:hypothetical protein